MQANFSDFLFFGGVLGPGRSLVTIQLDETNPSIRRRAQVAQTAILAERPAPPAVSGPQALLVGMPGTLVLDKQDPHGSSVRVANEAVAEAAV